MTFTDDYPYSPAELGVFKPEILLQKHTNRPCFRPRHLALGALTFVITLAILAALVSKGSL